MRFAIAVVCALAVPALGSSVAAAANCPGNPDALGTSRTLVIDPAEHQLLGTMQYRETLPLNDKEVVITFDDGPLPPYSNRVLETLNAECVKATYFIVGRMAKAYPETVRRIYAAGHSVGTHSQNHPFTFARMGEAAIQTEVEAGIASTNTALGDIGQVAPFFRIPGLARANAVEKYLSDRNIMTWSADFPADDWRHIGGPEVMKRALERLEAKGKGILLLHDIQPATALMLPELLKELKARGYKIVHVVAATPNLPKTATLPEQWLLRGGVQAEARTAKLTWPTPQTVDLRPGVLLPAPNPNSFGVDPAFAEAGPVYIPPARARMRRGEIPLPPLQTWPRSAAQTHDLPAATLPVPGLRNLGVPDVEKAVLTSPTPAPMKAAMATDSTQQAAPATLRVPQRINPALRIPGAPGQWPVPEVRPRHSLMP
ncbi:MAG: Polysaccharide deacetylase [Xanthobacteraceae bacterium]|jgi:peptidoglycan/xylan/chitin deacetylase (PgdA/CDA1 family)|nr:Polysaccharide deacetylase [Xanthobacteraceae bacterium]